MQQNLLEKNMFLPEKNMKEKNGNMKKNIILNENLLLDIKRKPHKD